MMVYASHDWQGLLGQTKCDLDETPHVCPNSSDVLHTGDLPHIQKIPGIKKVPTLRSLLAEVVQKHDDDQTK